MAPKNTSRTPVRHHASMYETLRQSWLYAAAAEASYFLRWLILKVICFVVNVLPVSLERREQWIIQIGNTVFSTMIGREVYASYESYVSLMGSSLDTYAGLYP